MAKSSRVRKQRVRKLIDELPLLEEEYLDYEYTLPYTEAVLDALADSAAQRVLAVWPDSLTRLALARYAGHAEVWLAAAAAQDGANPVVSAASLLAGVDLPAGGPYDAILLNCVVEHLPGDIAATLRLMAERLAPEGVLLVTTRQAGRLSLRLRAFFGRHYAPNPYRTRASDLPRGWNEQVAYRYYFADEIGEAAGAAGLDVAASRYVEGFAPWNGNERGILPLYLGRQALHALRKGLPAAREFAFLTLRPQAPASAAAPADHRRLPDLPETPFVSVVVPTYNRSQVLYDLLGTLFKQTYPRDRFEIIVVDNASTDDTPAMIEAAQAESPVPLHYYRKENEGPAVSRNYGVARARGQIIGFIDSDCLADIYWIEGAVARFTDDVALIAGPIAPRDNIHKPVGFFAHTIAPHMSESPLYPTANIFYRKDVLEAVGGFDPQFGAYAWGTPVGGEDTDLAWRVREAGYRHLFADDLIIGHQATPVTAKKWLLDGRRAAVAPLLVRRYPQLRRQWLFGGIFFSPVSALFYMTATGAVLGVVRSRKWLLLSAPWLFLMREFVLHDLRSLRRWPKAMAKIVLVFTLILIQTVTLWQSSIKNRTPVL